MTEFSYALAYDQNKGNFCVLEWRSAAAGHGIRLYYRPSESDDVKNLFVLGKKWMNFYHRQDNAFHASLASQDFPTINDVFAFTIRDNGLYPTFSSNLKAAIRSDDRQRPDLFFALSDCFEKCLQTDAFAVNKFVAHYMIAPPLPLLPALRQAAKSAELAAE